MKKLVLLLTVLMLCFSCASALAVTAAGDAVVEFEPFDHTVLKKLPGYEYDKFEKYWSYYGACSKKYSDAYIVIGIQADEDTTYEGGVFCQLYCWFRDENNRNTLYDIDELMILADDTLITCQMKVGTNDSYVMITPESEEVLKLIAEAKSLTFRLCYGSRYTTIEPTAEDRREMQAVAKNMMKYNMIDYCDPAFANWSALQYPITIEK